MSKNIRNTNQVTITSTPTTLTSAGGTSLVANGTSNPLEIKGISSSSLTITPNSGYLQIEGSGPVSVNDSGFGPNFYGLVYQPNGPNMITKMLTSSDGSVQYTDNGNGILDLQATAAAGPTGPTGPSGPGNYADVTTSGNSIIFRSDGSASTSITTGDLYLKTLVAGSNITIDNSAPYSSLTISSTSGSTTMSSVGGTSLVNNGSSNPLELKGLNSNSGTISISDMGSYINLESAGITGPQGPTGPAGTTSTLQGTGAGQSIVVSGGTNPLVVFDVESGDNITISNISGTKLRFDGRLASAGTPYYNLIAPGNTQLKDIQPGSNCGIIDNSTYLTINNVLYNSPGGLGYSLINGTDLKTIVFNGLTVVDHGSYLEVSNP